MPTCCILWFTVRVPTLLVTKIPMTFPQNTEALFQDLRRTPAMLKYIEKQQLLWDPGRLLRVYNTDKIWASNFRTFWHQHLHHCVRLPHHSLENSRTFQDQTHFPGFSRAWKFYRKNPGLSGRCGNPVQLTQSQENAKGTRTHVSGN